MKKLFTLLTIVLFHGLLANAHDYKTNNKITHADRLTKFNNLKKEGDKSINSISGSNTVCVGAQTQLTETVSGGKWSSNNKNIATVSSSGMVTGVAAGNVTITYTATGYSSSQTITVNALPTVAAISGTSSVCKGLSVQLTDSTTGGSWSSSNTAKATVDANGNVTGVGATSSTTISYTVTDGSTGCVNVAKISNFTVYDLPTYTSIKGTNTLCANASVTLTNSTGGGVWSSSNTGVATVASNGVVSGVAGGNATISYTYSDAHCSNTATLGITVNPIPDATIYGATAVCVNNTTQLNYNMGGGTWSSNNTAISTVTGGGLVTGVASGTATISYTVATSSCGTATQTMNIAVNYAAITSQSTSAATYCLNATATALSVTATGNNLNYQWYSNTSNSNTGGTLINGATSASYTPLTTSAVSKYYYCVVSSGSCITTSAVSGQITVNGLPAIISQTTDAATYCQNDAATALTVTASGTGLTYQWYSTTINSFSGGTLISSATSASYIPSTGLSGGSYYYCVVSANSCTSTSAVSGLITVNPLPVIVSQITDSATYSLDSSANPFSVTATGNNLTYLWYINAGDSNTGGTSIDTAIYSTFTPPTNFSGSYYYYAVVNSGVCSARSAVSGSVNTKGPIIPRPTILWFTPNSSCQGTSVTIYIYGSNFISSSTVSIGTTALTNINVVSSSCITATVPITGASGHVIVSAPPFGSITSTGTFSNSIGYSAFAYVPIRSSTGGNGTVNVINTITDQKVANITVGVDPVGVCASPDGTKVYITNETSNTISVIDTKTNTNISTFGSGSNLNHPFGICVNPVNGYVFVTNNTNANTSYISEFDNNNNFIKTISLTGAAAAGICISPDGNTLYVPNFITNSEYVSVINTVTYKTTNNIKILGLGGTAVCISPDGLYVYVTCGLTSKVVIINTNSKTAMPPIKISNAGDLSGICISPDETNVYVQSGGTYLPVVINQVFVIQTNNNNTVSGTNFNYNNFAEGIAITPDGNNLYSLITNGKEVLDFNITGNSVQSTISESDKPVALGNFIVNVPHCCAPTAKTPATQTVCVGTALQTIMINTTGATGITFDGVSTGVNGLPPGVSATFNTATNTITISGTPTMAGPSPTYTYSIPLTGGCGSVKATGTIIVTPNNTAGIPSSNPIVCMGTAIPTITIPTTGATGIGTSTGLPSGVTVTWASNIIKISGTPTMAGTSPTYTYTYSIPLTGGCGSVNATGTITVNPLPSVGTITGGNDLTLCTVSPSELLNCTSVISGVWSIDNASTNNATITIGGTVTAASTVGDILVHYKVTDANGCSNIASTTINVINCPDPGYVVCNDATPLDIKQEGTYTGFHSVPSLTIVNGSTTKFIDAECIMQKGSKITVKSGGALVIKGSHFYSCDEMWQGIDVEPGGRLQITGTSTHSSFIEDAKTAVHFDMQDGDGLSDITLPIGGFFLSVDNTVFNRNYNSISIENYAPNSTVYPFFVKNTVFTCRRIPFISGSLVWDNVETIKNVTVLNNTPYPQTPGGMSSPYIDETVYPSDKIASFLKVPYPNQKPNAGIILNNVGYADINGNNTQGVTIGYSYRDYDPTVTEDIPIELERPSPGGGGVILPTYNTSVNVFDNMGYYGIEAYNSNLTSVNNTFQKGALTDNGYGQFSVTTIGIYTNDNDIENNSLNVFTESPGSTPNNAFFDQSGAVHSNYYSNNTINNADIRCAMINEDFVGNGGITVQTNNLGSVDINNNKIYNVNMPIILYAGNNGTLNGPVNINSNTIDMCLTSGGGCGGQISEVGIWLLSGNISSIPNADDLNCNGNVINNAHNGIFASSWGLKNTIFDNNQISLVQYPGGGDQYGIHVDAGINNPPTGATGDAALTNHVTNNTVTGDGAAGETAIDLQSNSGLYVGCNAVSLAGNGIRFTGGSNLNNKCWDNQFDATGATNMNGLTMDNANGSVIDMTGTITGTVCTADNMWTGTNWGSNGNYETNCLNGTNSRTIPMNVQNSTVYNPDGYSNPNLTLQQNFISYGVSAGSIFVPTSTGTCNHDCSNIGGRKSHSIFSSGNNGLKSKANNTNNSSNFGGSGISVTNLEHIALGQVPISSADSAIRLYVMQQQLYGSLLADTALQNSSITLQEFVENNRGGSLGTINVLDSLFAKGNIAAANSALGNWVLQNSVDINYYRYYNWLFAKADSSRGLSRQDTTDIFTLALGCPQTDGKVVFAARNLFSNLMHQYLNYPNTCSNGSQYKLVKNKVVKDQNLKAENEVLIYPNPTKGNINIEFPSDDMGCSNIRVTDIYGRIIMEKLSVSNKDNINLQINGNSGIYLLTISDCETGKQEVKKIYLNK